MNRTIFALFAGLLFVFAVSVSAQTNMSFGIKGGLAMATMYGKDATVEDGVEKVLRYGMDIGAAFNLALSDLATIGIEARYAQKGMKTQGTPTTVMMAPGATSGYYTNTKLDYLDIPILFTFTPARSVVAPYFLAGPQLSIMLSATESGTMLGLNPHDVTLNSSTAPVDFGLDAGAGISITTALGKAVIEYRYSIGFLTTTNSGSGTNIVTKNMVPATISIGYLVDLL